MGESFQHIYLNKQGQLAPNHHSDSTLPMLTGSYEDFASKVIPLMISRMPMAR